MATKPHGTADLTFYPNYLPPDNFRRTPSVETVKIEANGHNRISLKKIANAHIKTHGYTPLERWKKSRSSDWMTETHTRQLDKGILVTLSFRHK